jgi:hypothetical protein
MRYEEGLACLKLGTAEPDAETCRSHLQRAVEIFDTMGALPELETATRALAALG